MNNSPDASEAVLIPADVLPPDRKDAPFASFEVVREDQRRVFVTRSPWQIFGFILLGALMLAGVIFLVVAAIILGLVIGIPVMIFKALASLLFPPKN